MDSELRAFGYIHLMLTHLDELINRHKYVQVILAEALKRAESVRSQDRQRDERDVYSVAHEMTTGSSTSSSFSSQCCSAEIIPRMVLRSSIRVLSIPRCIPRFAAVPSRFSTEE